MEKDEKWDVVIRPRKSLLDIDLAELWNYRFLVGLFVRRDFVSQYKQTILGPIWHLLQPVFTTAIYLLLFSRIARIPTSNIPPILFYVTGITIWTYFSQSLVFTSTTFVANAGIFGKVYFPRLVMPVSITLSTMMKLCIQFMLVIGAMVYYHFNGFPIQPSFTWLLLPLLVILIALMSFGLGIITSSLTTKYRDLSVLLTFAIQLGMYATPVVYPYSFLKGTGYAWAIAWNPLTPVFEVFRSALFGQPLVELSGLWYSLIFTVVALIGGVLLFSKVESSFMDTV
jgi:lipopolysaccharide transport system permease protein